MGECLRMEASAVRIRAHTQPSSPAKAVIQYPGALVIEREAAAYWVPAGACHRARRRRDPVGGGHNLPARRYAASHLLLYILDA